MLTNMMNSSSSLEVSRLYSHSPILLNNLIVTSFNVICRSVQQQDTRIYEHCNKDRIYDLGYYDIFEIKNEIKSSPQKIQQHITGEGIGKIARKYQHKRQLDIILIKNAVKNTIRRPYVQVDQRVKSKNIPIKDVHQQPAYETHDHTVLLTTHKSV